VTRGESLSVVADHAEKCVVGLDDPAVEIPDEDANDVGVDQAPTLRFALAQCSLSALAFGYIDVGTENLDNLSARGEPMLGGYVEILDCSIRQYDSELPRVVSFLAYRLLDPFPYLASIVWVDPLPHSIAARKALQRINPPDAVVFLRIIDSRQGPIGDPGASVAQPLCFRQIGLAAA
jgi:hypothetical protein